MKTIKNFYNEAVAASVPLAASLTEATRTIKFTSTGISKVMDTMNGGVMAHGGFHRVFGGHSTLDWNLWSNHGTDFPIELAKDSLTPNGLPLPGVETLVRKGFLKATTAQSWGSLCIGKMVSASIGIFDTGINLRKAIKDEEAFKEVSNSVILKGAIKVATATAHSNIPLAIAGVIDIGLGVRSKIGGLYEFNFDELGHMMAPAYMQS